ncbi:hypothetical protein BASA82_001044 [Batrachochytrium salamandrivorans]|nr:hypothetical protein BASA82_001044 [Batrachochytrium salamandrivorans]
MPFLLSGLSRPSLPSMVASPPSAYSRYASKAEPPRADLPAPLVHHLGTGWHAQQRPRLVILGTGWAATSIIKQLHSSAYEIIVFSPKNYFVFTPLLPGATTGTVEPRSLLESIRKICYKSGARYIQANAQDVDFNKKQITFTDPNGPNFLISYDKLVVAVGARNETYGIPGVHEHVHFLKSIQDSLRIRAKIMQLFESASVPNISIEEKKKLLNFVIVGGGPTGVEFAAELFDFLDRDMIKFFPDLLQSFVRITIIQGSGHVLNTFDIAISKYTENRFKRQNINVVTNSFVISVDKDRIVYKCRDPDTGNDILHEINYGLCVWSTGIAMHDFTKRLAAMTDRQKITHALCVDSHLRIKGVRDVYALGDCATIRTPNILDIVNESLSKEESDTLSIVDFDRITKEIMDQHPQTRALLLPLCRKIHASGKPEEVLTLNIKDIKEKLAVIDKNITLLPATAQVASQQGRYLAKKLNTLSKYDQADWYEKEDRMKPFVYRHLGSFSYVGHESTVFDSGTGWTTGGFGAWFLWRSAYLSRQVSLRTRVLLAWDWTKTFVFGRDISKI